MMYHTPPEPQPTQTLSMQNYGEHENMATKSYRHKTIIKLKKEKKKRRSVTYITSTICSSVYKYNYVHHTL